MHLSDAAANASIDAVVGPVDGGTLELWSGAMPGTTDGAPAGDLLAEITYEAIAFGGATVGEREAQGVPLSTEGLAAAGAGTAIGFYRVCASNGDTEWQSDQVATSGSSGLVVNTLNVSEGVTITVTAHTVTQPTGV